MHTQDNFKEALLKVVKLRFTLVRSPTVVAKINEETMSLYPRVLKPMHSAQSPTADSR